MELEVGKSVSVKIGGEPPKMSSSSSTAAPENKVGGDADAVKLEELVRKLSIKEFEKRLDVLTKLEEERRRAVEAKRKARKQAWRESKSKGLLEGRGRGSCSDFQKRMLALPQETLKMILKDVQDPKDKAVLARMSGAWRDLLKKQRTRYLFHEAFPILYESGCLSTNEILRCRLGCQEWNSSIQTHLQSLIYSKDIELDDKLDFTAPPPYIDLQLRFDLDVQCFFLCLEKGYKGTNPFISRNLTLGVPFPILWWNNTDFWEWADKLLTRWGRELWHIRIVLDAGLLYTQFFDRLAHFLRLMPNLRSLNVVHNEARDPTFDEEDDLSSDLRHHMRRKSLPPLPHLRRLQTTNVPHVLVQNMMETYAGTLDSCIIGLHEDDRNDFKPRKLPHLKEFACLGTTVNDFSFHGEWPRVESIRMKYFEVEACDLAKIFQDLDHFGDSLCHLVLTLHKNHGPYARVGEELQKGLALNLPNLETITLSLFRIGFNSIDFMLPLSSLKKITLKYVKKAPKKKGTPSKSGSGSGSTTGGQAAASSPTSDFPGQIIQFSDYTNCLYESNIWRLFPELRKVTIKVINKIMDEDKIPHPERMLKPSTSKAYYDEAVDRKVKIYTRVGYKKFCEGQGADGSHSQK